MASTFADLRSGGIKALVSAKAAESGASATAETIARKLAGQLGGLTGLIDEHLRHVRADHATTLAGIDDYAVATVLLAAAVGEVRALVAANPGEVVVTRDALGHEHYSKAF